METKCLRVGCEVLTAVVMKSPLFWDITPCSPLKVNRRFGEACRSVCYLLHAGFLVKVEATCSSETSVDIQRTIRRYIAEDRTLQIFTFERINCVSQIVPF
jgi:hypothetical protein